MNNNETIKVFSSLLDMKEEELKKVASDKEEPLMKRILAKALFSEKGFDVTQLLLTHIQKLK